MADNYLENKMEEHRRMMAGRPNVSRRPAPGGALKFEPRRIVVAVTDPALREAVVKVMRQAGHHVSFADADSRRGNLLAQATGARCYPMDASDRDTVEKMMTDVERKCGKPDFLITDYATAGVESCRMIIITDSAPANNAGDAAGIIMASESATSVTDAASVALMLTHQSARNFGPVTLTV